MKRLRISPDLSLPLDSVTESIAILAKRGAGKTYAASVLVEEMLKAKLQVVVLDPMGAWWGLRSSADGKGEGFPIAILGGDHGDVPLEPTGGSVAADLLVDERLPAILDLASFSKNERRSFVAAFLERLYQRNREAMHVVLEEADLFAPEGKLKRAGDEAMLGAVYDLVRRGRGRGMGSTLITQRSASLSKEVLTQAEILLALRTTGPHDRAAIEEWIKFHGSKDERDVVLSSLAELPTGEAWAWWPVEGILKRIRIRKRETFDSSATPKPGETKREPKTLADVDLAALHKRMAATIEKAKADDPRALRKKILELEQLVRKQDRGLTKPKPEVVVEEKLVEVPVPVFNGEVDRLEAIVKELAPVGQQIADAGEQLHTAAELVAGAIATARGGSSMDRASARRAEGAGSTPARRSSAEAEQKSRRSGVKPGGVAPAQRPPREPHEGDEQLPAGAATKMLNVLAQFPEGRTKRQLGVLAGVKAGGSTYRAGLATLRKLGYVTAAGVEPIQATEAGIAACDVEPLPIGHDLYLYWRRELGTGATSAMLDVLYEAYPDGVDRDELADQLNIERGGSTFRAAAAKLRNLNLATPAGVEPIRAADELFQEPA